MSQVDDLKAFCDWALRDPVGFIQRALGFHLWSKQVEIVRAATEHRRAAIRSCHGVGKTATVGRIIVRDMVAYGLRQAAYGQQPSCRIITTAPNFDPGVKRLLWPQIHAGAYALNATLRSCRLPVMPSPNLTEWNVSPDWFAAGLSTDEPERFQGHHADFLRLVVDEASGVDEEIYAAGRGFTTGGEAYTLLIGNPTRTVGTFREAFGSDKWAKVHVSAFDCPAFTGEAVPEQVLQVITGRQFVEDMREDYGEDDPQFTIRVLGEFAETSGRAFFNRQHLASMAPVEPVTRGEYDVDTSDWLASGAGRVWVWATPQPGVDYVVAVDPAGLTKRDEDDAFTDPRDRGDDVCIQVLDADGNQVAEFLGRIDGDHAGRVAVQLARVYNRALLSIELEGGYGDACLTEVRRLRYRRLFRRKRYDHQQQKTVTDLGWTTTPNSRMRMLDTAKAQLREAPLSIRSSRLAAQLRTFVVNDKARAEADAGTHDDAVLAWAQALEVRRQRFEGLVELEEREQSLEERALEWRKTPAEVRRMRRLRERLLEGAA